MQSCPHCNRTMFRLSQDGSKVKTRTTCFVMHKSGEIEINCPKCGRGVMLPFLSVQEQKPKELRKAKPEPRYVVRGRKKP